MEIKHQEIIESILNKEVKERKKWEHQFLLKHKFDNDVRRYLLSMGEFKDVKIKADEKEIKEIKLQDYIIVDPSNVCGIYPLKKDGGEFEELETELCFFKKVENPKVTAHFNKRWEIEVMKINGSNYPKLYLDEMKRIASVWFSNVPEIFMSYDKEKKEFIKDEPIMFVFDWKLAFILAPRIDDERDEE